MHVTRVATLIATLLGVAFVEQACDLSTPPPSGVVLPSSIAGKASLTTQLAGAVGDLSAAYGGSADGGNLAHQGFILLSGLFTDELQAKTATNTYIDVDHRAAVNVMNVNSLIDSMYRDLQRARASAEQTRMAYRQLDSAAVGELYASNLAGFAYVLLGEAFCSGIPFSQTTPDGVIAYGTAESTAQVFARALSAFDSALALEPSVRSDHPDSSESIAAQVNLARVGRARTLLDLGRFADAGAQAERVPDGFEWKLEYSNHSPREVNGIQYHTWTTGEYSASDSEGVNGIAFVARGDPRVQVVDTFIYHKAYLPRKYSSPSASIVLASGTEARLIQAEAQLQAGDASGSLMVLNALRASIGLVPLHDPGTNQERITQLFRERALWLWLTGHRLGDFRRLMRQYGRSDRTVYPTGDAYGNGLALPLNDVNNPRYSFKVCDPTQA